MEFVSWDHWELLLAIRRVPLNNVFHVQLQSSKSANIGLVLCDQYRPPRISQNFCMFRKDFFSSQANFTCTLTSGYKILPKTNLEKGNWRWQQRCDLFAITRKSLLVSFFCRMLAQYNCDIHPWHRKPKETSSTLSAWVLCTRDEFSIDFLRVWITYVYYIYEFFWHFFNFAGFNFGNFGKWGRGNLWSPTNFPPDQLASCTMSLILSSFSWSRCQTILQVPQLSLSLNHMAIYIHLLTILTSTGEICKYCFSLIIL